MRRFVPLPQAGTGSASALPAELLWLAGRALRDHDVDESRAAVVDRLVEGSLQVFRVLDGEALAAEGFHRPVVEGAIDQSVGLHVEHRVVREACRGRCRHC